MELTEIDTFRDYLGCRGLDSGRWSDEELGEAIERAKKWIGRWRYSWKVVATNVLLHGEPRP